MLLILFQRMLSRETKTQTACRLLMCGEVKEALKIFRSFRIGWSKEEKRKIDIACECLCGNDDFYTSLGIDCRKVVEEAVELLKAKYL